MAPLQYLTKRQAIWLFLQSFVIEIYCMFFGQGNSLNGLNVWSYFCEEWSPIGFCKRVQENWRHIQEDKKLLDAVLSVLAGIKEHETMLDEEIKKEAKNVFLSL